jgi:hypothetical protein
MKCEHVEELLWELCDESLGGDARCDLEDHISRCERCRKKKEEIARTLVALKDFGAIEPSEDFAAGLRDKIDAWEASRQVIWLASVAAFIRRNRRAIVTCCLVFTVSLVSGIFALRNLSREQIEFVESPGVTRDYAIRDIDAVPVVSVSEGQRPDTVYMRFVTREVPLPSEQQFQDYVFEPVVAPVTDVEPAF